MMKTKKKKEIIKILKNLLKKDTFKGSEKYWEKRYNSGGDSGRGSYDKFAEFKADVINDFVKENDISSVIEFGCGDGNQLKYYHFEKYLGLDVSEKVIQLCNSKFAEDNNKSFDLISNYHNQKADLSMSIDVIYHLVEDEVFNKHIDSLFKSSDKYVIIYSSNSDELNTNSQPHVRHRKFTERIEEKHADFELINHLKNKYPFSYDNKEEGSHADFYFYKKK